MSLDNPTLTPVPFYEDTITCIETPDGVFVAVRPMCERLGIDWSGQLKKLKAEKRWRGGAITTPSAGGPQETYCVPLSKVAGFLLSIQSSRVKPEVREALRLYQDEADDVLYRHFTQLGSEKDAIIAIQAEQLAACHRELLIAQPRWAQVYHAWEDGTEDRHQMRPPGMGRATHWAIMARMQDCGIVGAAGAADASPTSLAERMREMQRELNRARAALRDETERASAARTEARRREAMAAAAAPEAPPAEECAADA